MSDEEEERPRYVNLRQVGEGSFGFIFKATDTMRGERVALKIIRGALDSPFATKRVLRELVILRNCRLVQAMATHVLGAAPRRARAPCRRALPTVPRTSHAHPCLLSFMTCAPHQSPVCRPDDDHAAR